MAWSRSSSCDARAQVGHRDGALGEGGTQGGHQESRCALARGQSGQPAGTWAPQVALPRRHSGWHSKGRRGKAVNSDQARGWQTPGRTRKQTPPGAGAQAGAHKLEAEVPLGSELAQAGRATVGWQLLGDTDALGVDHSRVQPASKDPRHPHPRVYHGTAQGGAQPSQSSPTPGQCCLAVSAARGPGTPGQRGVAVPRQPLRYSCL